MTAFRAIALVLASINAILCLILAFDYLVRGNAEAGRAAGNFGQWSLIWWLVFTVHAPERP
jgi:hypothetical protein